MSDKTMKMITVRIFLPHGFLFCSFLLACVFQVRDASTQELKIDREKRTVPYSPGSTWPREWNKAEGDLYRARFYVPPRFLNFEPNSFSSDPPTLQETMEAVGITFGKGAKAEYFPKISTVRVVQTHEQLELIEAFLYSYKDPPEKQLSIRVEIYELPALQVLELVDSAEAEGDHTPERNAVFDLVKEGHARFVAMPSLTARSGAKSKVIDGDETFYYKEMMGKEGVNRDKKIVKGTRPAGTIFEVYPILGVDNRTMDIAVWLEHHTAQPVLKSVANRSKTPLFHSKTIITQITIKRGDYVLIGTWRPTGKPEYKKKDLMHVVFLTANVQTVRGHRSKESVAPEKSEKPKGE